MRAVSKGVVHKNTGARKVSRLHARLKKLATRLKASHFRTKILKLFKAVGDVARLRLLRMSDIA